MTKIDDSDPWIDKTDPTIQRNHVGAIQCGAIKKNGERCRGTACIANGSQNCRIHGGLKRRDMGGMAPLPGGAHTRSLPQRLIEKYRQAQEDPELLSSRSDVALLEARMLELTERLSTGESGELWRDLRNLVKEGDRCKDFEELQSVVKSMAGIVETGCADEHVWKQMHETLEQKTKVSAHEWKRLIDMKQVITAEKATTFAMRVLEIVMNNVPEPDRQRKIAREIKSLMNIQPVVIETFSHNG